MSNKLSLLALLPVVLVSASQSPRQSAGPRRVPLAGPAPGIEPIAGISLDQRYVNDGQGEVDGADIVDGSLTGADVSTTSGDVNFGGNATITARKGVFGLGSDAIGQNATVSGGYMNTASNFYATVSGGRNNLASGVESSVGGGYFNRATGYASTVAGGSGNSATAWRGTVAGGEYNHASGQFSAISGGEYNQAAGYISTVGGGQRNEALGAFSFAAGRFAKANHGGSFVWGDSAVDPTVVKQSSTNNQFNVYASGGVRIFSNVMATSGVLLAPGGGSWTSVSDRNAKENVVPVDGEDVLERLSRVPIATWNYKAQDASIRHMGPMAQDFHAAFGLGLGATTIDSIDSDGVAMAAIQGLSSKLGALLDAQREQEQRIDAQATRIAALMSANEVLRERLAELETSLAQEAGSSTSEAARSR
jgi:hypothetical protein